MVSRALIGSIALAAGLGAPSAARAQATTQYHLHKEASTVNSANKQLKTIGPDATQTALQTVNLKNNSGNFASSIANFETQAGVPGKAGTIPAGSVVSFGLRMRVTRLPASGSIYSYVILSLNSSAGAFLCSRGQQDGLPALTTSLTLYSFTCSTFAAVTMTTSDRFFLQAGVWVAATTGNQNLFGELDVETNADSTVGIPNPGPTITSLTATSGIVGDTITINGTGFGSSGTVTFNGAAATTSSWTSTAIQATVPAAVPGGAGPVVVSAGGVNSNGATFTALPHITDITPGSGPANQSVTISGTTFGTAAGSVTFNGVPASNVATWNNTSIGVTVPTAATSGPVIVSVGANSSAGFGFTVVTTGTLAGTITRATGGSAISGATVQAALTGIIKATAVTAVDGSYSIPNLDTGSYDVRVSASGFSPEVRSGTSIAAGATTPVNVGMLQPGSVSGAVTQSSGGSPIAGAAVALFLGSAQKASTSTDANGNYSVANLHPGAYTVQAANVGNRTKEQGVTIPEAGNAIANLALDAAATGPVQYVYDELNRLVSVVDPAGDAAHYQYDAVGNLLSIARAGGTAVSISEFTPNGGPVGAIVTISGTGFSATPSQNTVTFNGTAALVSAAGPNQLTVAVPAGATTGTIGVSTPGGSATSAASFTVGSPAGGVPSITGFTPATASAGTALTVNGTNFDTTPANDNLRLNAAFTAVTSATATAMQATVPATATTGRVSLTTPGGAAESASYLWVAPPPYAAASIDSTTSVSFGTAAPVSVPADATSTKIALLAFEGTDGNRAAIDVTGISGGSASLYLYGTSGAVIQKSQFILSAGFVDTALLRATGTYTVVFDPESTNATTANLTVYDVPPDFTSAIAFENPVTATTTVAGQNAKLTFVGSPGHRVSVNQAGFNCFTSHTSILAPDGEVRKSGVCGGAFIDPVALTTAGTYTILVDPSGSVTGSTTLTLYDVPADVTGSIAFGTPTPVTTTVPGQNGQLTFTGTAGHRVSLAQGGYNCFQSNTVIHEPKADGSPDPNGPVLVQGCSAFIDPVALDVTGTYTIVVDPTGSVTGTATLTLYDVPSDATGTLTINDPATPVALQTPGQNGVYTFSGANLQQVTVRVTSNTIGGTFPCVTVSLLRQSGSTVASSTSCGSSFNLSQQTLPATETYTVKVDPAGNSTGTLNLQVTSP